MAYYFNIILNCDQGGFAKTIIFHSHETEKFLKYYAFLQKIEKQHTTFIRSLLSQNFCPDVFKQDIASFLPQLDKGYWIEVTEILKM